MVISSLTFLFRLQNFQIIRSPLSSCQTCMIRTYTSPTKLSDYKIYGLLDLKKKVDLLCTVMCIGKGWRFNDLCIGKGRRFNNLCIGKGWRFNNLCIGKGWSFNNLCIVDNIFSKSNTVWIVHSIKRFLKNSLRSTSTLVENLTVHTLLLLLQNSLALIEGVFQDKIDWFNNN